MTETVATPRRIDIHVHAVADPTELNGMTLADSVTMAKHLRSIGTDRAVLVNGFLDPAGEAATNENQRRMAEASDGVFVWGCLPFPEDPDTMLERVTRYREQGAALIGEVTWQGFDFDHPVTQAMFAAAEQVGIPVLMHISPDASRSYGLGDEPGLPQFEESLKRFPNLTFIGHSQPFWHEISGETSSDYEGRNAWGEGPVAPGGRLGVLLDRYPNLYCDLSANSGGQALMRDPEFGLAFLATYADRLMFGTDMVHPDMSFPLGDWLIEQRDAGRITPSDYDKVVRGNAMRVLGM